MTTETPAQQQKPCKWTCELTNDRGYVVYSALGSFYIPMFVMLFFYWRIYRAAVRTTRAINQGFKTTKGKIVQPQNYNPYSHFYTHCYGALLDHRIKNYINFFFCLVISWFSVLWIVFHFFFVDFFSIFIYFVLIKTHIQRVTPYTSKYIAENHVSHADTMLLSNVSPQTLWFVYSYFLLYMPDLDIQSITQQMRM